MILRITLLACAFLAVSKISAQNNPIYFDPQGGAGGDLYGIKVTETGNNTSKLHIYRNFSFESTDVDRLVINSAGNVGIGHDAPITLLDLKPYSNNTDVFRISHPTAPADAGFIIGFGNNGNGQDNSSIDFKAEYSGTIYEILGIDRTSRDFYYNGAGNVGIGTSSPSEKLSVNGKANLNGTDDDNIRFLINGSNGLTAFLGDAGGGSDGQLGLYENSGGNLSVLLQGTGNSYFNTNGNLGIGNNSPLAKLDIKAASSNQELLRLSHPTAPANASFNIGFGTDGNGQDNSSVDFKVQFSSNTYNVLGIDRTSRDFYYNGDGNVGIGTTSPNSKLTVAGNINSREVKVTVNAGADFVFEDDYNLRTLEETEQFITENNHLPEIASADEMVENGLEVGEMNIKLLQKVEELTLYMIEMNKEMKSQKEEINLLKSENQKLNSELTELKKGK